MEQNYTPLTIKKSTKRVGPDINVLLIIIALVITVLLGGMLWYMIEQKRQEEVSRTDSFEEGQQTIRNVQVDTAPTHVASPTAALLISPTATPSATPVQATQSANLEQ